MSLAVLAAAALLAAPPPNAPLPRDADGIARALTERTAALQIGIDKWRRTGGPLPAEVELDALYQQRLFISLSQRPELAQPVLQRLGGKLQREAGQTVAARAALVRLTPPTTRPLALVPDRPGCARALAPALVPGG